MKKIVSLISAIAMFVAISGVAIAADNNPAVYVNDREIFFDDQPAVIKDDRTLVPARGVFEAMGAKVDWDGEKRQVEVTSADENTIVRLVIDDADMKVYDMSGLFAALLSGQGFKAPETVVALDVPAQIMNDRTMVPLRAISEAFNSEVEWNGEAYCVDITTKDKKEAPAGAPELSLSASTSKLEAGETVDILVNLKNIPADTFVRSVESAIKYDKENFELVSVTLVNGEEEIGAAASSFNPNYADGCMHASYIVSDAENAVKEDGAVLKVTFKSLNGKTGVFALSDAYQTRLGYTNSLIVKSISGEDSKGFKGNNLKIDSTPVIVNLTAE